MIFASYYIKLLIFPRGNKASRESSLIFIKVSRGDKPLDTFISIIYYIFDKTNL